MTLLRKQLESARDEYRAIRYEGDLAREILSPPTRWRGAYLLGAILTGAIAASVFLATLLPHPFLTPAAARGRTPLVQEFQLPSKMPFSVPGLPRMGPHMSFREMAPSLVPPGGWHVPSLEDLHVPAIFGESGRA